MFLTSSIVRSGTLAVALEIDWLLANLNDYRDVLPQELTSSAGVFANVVERVRRQFHRATGVTRRTDFEFQVAWLGGFGAATLWGREQPAACLPTFTWFDPECEWRVFVVPVDVATRLRTQGHVYASRPTRRNPWRNDRHFRNNQALGIVAYLVCRIRWFEWLRVGSEVARGMSDLGTRRRHAQPDRPFAAVGDFGLRGLHPIVEGIRFDQPRPVLLDATPPDVLVGPNRPGTAPIVHGRLKIIRITVRRVKSCSVTDTEAEMGITVFRGQVNCTRVGRNRFVDSIDATPKCQCIAQPAPGIGRICLLGKTLQIDEIRDCCFRRYHLRIAVRGWECLLDEVGIECLQAGTDISHDTVLVDRNENRNGLATHRVNRIDEYRPVKLFPLREQTATLWMLFLGDAQHHEFALLHPGLSSFVPDRHVSAAARSPGSEVDEKHLTPTTL